MIPTNQPPNYQPSINLFAHFANLPKQPSNFELARCWAALIGANAVIQYIVIDSYNYRLRYHRGSWNQSMTARRGHLALKAGKVAPYEVGCWSCVVLLVAETNYNTHNHNQLHRLDVCECGSGTSHSTYIPNHQHH